MFGVGLLFVGVLFSELKMNGPSGFILQSRLYTKQALRRFAAWSVPFYSRMSSVLTTRFGGLLHVFPRIPTIFLSDFLLLRSVVQYLHRS
jgi:hypothetical protein